jgi:hypothetical protein
MEGQPVIGGFRFGQGRELARLRPVELARIHDHAAGDGAVAGQVFGGGMNDQRRPVFDRAAQEGRGRGVVDDKRNIGLVRHTGNRRNVRQRAARVADRFAKQGAGVRVNGRLYGFRIVEVDELRRPAELAYRVGELL